MKAPNGRERKRNKGQGPKTRQASSANKAVRFMIKTHKQKTVGLVLAIKTQKP
jgi:hypothetical protein